VIDGDGIVTAWDQFDAKLHALRSWVETSSPILHGIEHRFMTAEPMAEQEIRRIEEEAGISLPTEYREFLLRFGDGNVGPGLFSNLREGLTPASARPFPLAAPLLGRLSPRHNQLSKDLQHEDYLKLSDELAAISGDEGVLAICDYGCAIYGRLILNGPFCGKVWVLAGDADYYGPFGGSELLHDEFTPPEWEPTDTPRDYSFAQWYESWLDGQLKSAGIAEG
jgi:hypothetical protein